MSVAANIAHSYVPPPAAAPGWTPSPGAVLLAAFWPAAVFVAVEIMARASWAAGRRWVLVRWGGLAPVALVAAVVSYRHLAGLLGYYGEDPVTVAIGPARRRRPHDRLDRRAARDVARTPSRRSTSTRRRPLRPRRQSTRIESIHRARSSRARSSRPSDRRSSRPHLLEVDRSPSPGSTAAALDERAVPARVVSLLPATDGAQPQSETDYRPEDVERLKAAVMAGEIPWPIKYEPARKHLRINIKYVKAAARQIDDEGWTPGQEELLNA